MAKTWYFEGQKIKFKNYQYLTPMNRTDAGKTNKKTNSFFK